MSIKKNILTVALIGSLMGCVANDYGKMSAGSGIPEATLIQNCKPIYCSYDKLKDNVQASTNDMNILLSMAGGGETRTIQYTWVSGNNQISIDLYSTTLHSGWAFVDSAEIYIGKEMIAKVSGQVERIVGHYNESAREREKTEIVSGTIGIETAKRIAEANYKSVTIRFYGKGGYTDKELPREHNLINVVKLAELA